MPGTTRRRRTLLHFAEAFLEGRQTLTDLLDVLPDGSITLHGADAALDALFDVLLQIFEASTCAVDHFNNLGVQVLPVRPAGCELVFYVSTKLLSRILRRIFDLFALPIERGRRADARTRRAPRRRYG